nr:variable lymphocyte receptor [Lethenteron reissneri]
MVSTRICVQRQMRTTTGEVSRLCLRDSPPPKLEPGVLDSLTQLTYMGLSSNRLQALPEGVFDRLVNLQKLDLNNNQLKSVPRGATGDGAVATRV